jgi:hypothetical protein
MFERVKESMNQARLGKSELSFPHEEVKPTIYTLQNRKIIMRVMTADIYIIHIIYLILTRILCTISFNLFNHALL